jgi:hypothetical protein
MLPAVLLTARSTVRSSSPAAVAGSPERPSAPTPPAAAAGPRRGWLAIDPARMSCPRYAIECFDSAVAAGLLRPSDATRLAWLACWCEAVHKARAGKVRNPAAVLRWLLQTPKAFAEYPGQASEEKARRLLRMLQSQSRDGGGVG